MENRQHPLAEIFGFPVANTSAKAERYRTQRLCPFNNMVPNCTKDKANNPLGVCSVYHKNSAIITCPVRFREDWLIAEKAARFFFGEKTCWKSLTEIRLTDKNSQSAGHVDFLLVAYDQTGRITDFGSLEVQGGYMSGNLRNPFDAFLAAPSSDFFWETGLS